MQLYVDMDGVLADFDRHYEEVFGVAASKQLDNVRWEWVREREGFYVEIPPMADMEELWYAVEPFKPIVLTGVPSSVTEAYDNKKAWVVRHLGEHVPMIGCKSKEKCRYAKPGDVLIDDWEKYRHLWERAGGYWITHVSAASSVRALFEHLGLR